MNAISPAAYLNQVDPEARKTPHSEYASCPPSAAQRGERIDGLRTLLTMLVILHHTAITYGAIGGWYLKEPRQLSLSSVLLTIFCTINQAYFMGFFFLIAGYLTPQSLRRKGTRRFVGDRLVRLGIPLLIYGYVIGPATVALAATSDGEPFFDSLTRLMSHHYFEIGPLWFVEALLLFTAFYLVLHRLAKGANKTVAVISDKLAGRDHWLLAVAVLVVGTSAFLIRLRFKVGQNVGGLQLAYFASYIFLFALGCASSSSRLLGRVNRRFSRPWIWIAACFLPLLTLYAIASGALHGAPFDTRGGWNLPSLAYAFWEPLVAWGIILGFLSTKLLQTGGLARWLAHGAPLAFGAYIIHPPVLVGCTLLLHSWSADGLVKFGLVGAGAVLLSFAGALALRRIPGATRVI
jgi:fucose 4-O-acetylase-like acetyltransferase